jgi:hypothetical protein
MSTKEDVSKILIDRISIVSKDIRALENLYNRIGSDILKSNVYPLLKRDEALLKELLNEVMSLE